MKDLNESKAHGKPKKRTKTQLLATAFHEAGHALAQHRLGFKIKSVTVEGRGDYLGAVEGKSGLNASTLNVEHISGAALARWHDRIVSFLAGREAQRHHKPQSIRSYMARSDRNAVVDILWRLHPEPQEMKAVLKYLERRTHNLVHTTLNWAMITALASELTQKRTLSGEQVRAVFSRSFQEQKQLHRQAIRAVRSNSKVPAQVDGQ